MLKYILLCLSYFLTCTYGTSQKIDKNFQQDKSFNEALQKIVTAADLNGSFDTGGDGMEQISFAVIDLTSEVPVFGGVNAHNFLYPASVYKMYAAMEVLKQVSNGVYTLHQQYVVESPNDVDKEKEISYDPRPLLSAGDTVTINHLLDLMITRSDNTAANCIIDIAGRQNINATMHEYNWYGSEVTRKFLPRAYEDPGYDTIRGTESSAFHAADFMYHIYKTPAYKSMGKPADAIFFGQAVRYHKAIHGFTPGGYVLS